MHPPCVRRTCARMRACGWTKGNTHAALLTTCRAELDARISGIAAKQRAGSTLSVNLKACAVDMLDHVTSSTAQEVFQPFVTPCKEYLSQEPWVAFIQRHVCRADASLPHSAQRSAMFIRYCQWKHLELNLKARTASLGCLD